MSPHVANFVHDLVAMAKAMEENPVLQDQIEALKTQLGATQDHNAYLEINIISYKKQIDDLQATVRSLEVERDEASFRVLESEDLAHTALSFIKQAEVAAAAAMSLLNPSKPEPVKAPEPNREGLDYDFATDAWYPKAIEPVPELPQAIPSEPEQVNPVIYQQDTATGDFNNPDNFEPADAPQGQSESPPPAISSEASTSPVASTAESVDTPSAPSEPTQADVEPEPELRWSHEWYQWYNRKNERASGF